MTEFSRGNNICPVIIVKIGGSAITIKESIETLKPGVLDTVSEQISALLNGENGLRYILVHGAGSFGHFHAKEYQLADGGKPTDDDERWRRGLTATRQSVLKLNNHVMSSLHRNDAYNTISVSLFPHVICCKRVLSTEYENSNQTFLNSIDLLINHNFTPVLHGDVLFDSNQRCCVFSGDSILLW